MIEDVTQSALIENLNTKFRMHLDDSRVLELELIKVTDLGSFPGREQFSIIFLGPLDGPLNQGIFNLAHEKLGALALFLVPIGKDEDGIQYEAIFNRMGAG